jgi:hypothetical protein
MRPSYHAAVQDPKQLLPHVEWSTRRAFLQMAARFEAQTGYVLRVRSGRRTCQEQAEQYGIGRTYNLGSPTVTGARGCQSWHVLARAVDADPVHPATGKVVASCELASVAGGIWEQLGGVWGGRFGGFGGCGDQGHFEWHPGLSIGQFCPDWTACEAVSRSIQTRDPVSGTAWALGGFAVAFLAGWVVLTAPGSKGQLGRFLGRR